MNYLPPFNVLKSSVRLLSVKGQLKVDMSYDELLDMIKTFLRAVPVDDAWYRSTYTDVDEAIRNGAYRSARQHFIDHGYFEGRRPYRLEVDEAWYFKTYPDIHECVKKGELESALAHYERHGYEEGRRPADI